MLSWRRDKKDESADSQGQASNFVPQPSPDANPPSPGPASPTGRTRLGELLVQEGVITQLQLGEALAKQQQTGTFIGQTLVELGYLNQSTLVSFLVKQCKIPHISLLDYNVSDELFNLVPKEMCVKHRLLPIDKLGKILTLAMVNPLDADALERVRELCPDLKIKPILCTWNHFEEVSRKLFASNVDGPAEVSIGSFGLAPKKSATEPVVTAADEKSKASEVVAELVKEVVPARTTTAPTAPRPAAAPKPTNPVSPKLPAEVPAPARMQIPDTLFDRMGDHVRVALTDSLTPLIAEQQKLIALQLESSRAKPNELAREITASMRASLLEGLAPLVEAQGKHIAQPAPSIDTRALAKELGDSVRAAMLDSVLPALQASGPSGEGSTAAPAPAFDPTAMAEHFARHMDRTLAAFAKEMREAVSSKQEAPVPAFDPKGMVDQFAQHIDKSMALFGKDIRNAMAGHSPQRQFEDMAGRLTHALQSSSAAQNERIAELTDSTKEALLALREALDSMRAPAPRENDGPESNVSPFPGLHAGDTTQGNAAIPHFDPMEEIGLGVEADDRVREALLSGRLQRGFTFDAFLSGAANTFTLSVARAVTEQFSREFTPFYIYGDVGVGKTHLLHAIGNSIAARNPDVRTGYMTGLRFVSACERAARDQELEKFRETFAHWDVLLFDDAQSVATHQQAQDELRTVLGVLTNEGRLVVVSADRAPDQLPETTHQLVSRLAAGIVTRLHAPDMPTRIAILKRHVRVLKAKVADDILSLIASRVPADVRKMTGALRKALAYAQVSGTEVTHELTEEILSHLTAIEAA